MDEETVKPYTYQEARELLHDIIDGFRTISGDQVGPRGQSWQETAKATAVNLQLLGFRLEAALEGNVSDPPVQFPSPDDLEDNDDA